VNTGNPRAVIFACHSTTLSPAEKALFARSNPLGFILFSRNCESPQQVQELIQQLRQTVGREDVPILIDQEGGRVRRLKNMHWRLMMPARIFGYMAEDNPELAGSCVYDNYWLSGHELKALGITVNCAPVLDILTPETHPIIGDRAFGSNPELVTTLGLQSVKGLWDAGVVPVIKHLPGHGRANADSHVTLPIVDISQEDLLQSDFAPFRKVCQTLLPCGQAYPWGMTAHVVYSRIDEERPATFSPSIIEGIIRNHIGFSGFLVSDCITMKALEGPMGQRARRAIEAGCDAVLHCSGNLDDMIEVAASTPMMTDEAMRRFECSRITQVMQRKESSKEIAERLNNALRPYESLVDTSSQETIGE
jgi:beta-N-acetylhexosaminidase